MRTFTLVLLTVVATTACDAAPDITQYTGTPPLRIAGTWTYEFNVYDGALANCRTSGNVQINQTLNGDQFSGYVHGEYACINGGDVPEPVTALVPVTAGELTGLGVRFIAFGCVHLGALTDSTAKQFRGTLNCTFPVTENGPSHDFSGTWEASR
jgi:hypothetical protein